MAGELWRGTVQVGVESTYGTAVPATRRMYFTEPNLSLERQPRPKKFAVTTRDNTRAFKLGPSQAGGTLNMPMSATEIVEMLLTSIQGAVTPSAGVWTFKPSSSASPLDSMTVEWHDGARVWQGAGYYGGRLRLQGTVVGDNMVNCDMFGSNVVAGALTGTLAHRTPGIIEGWETQFFITSFGGTPGAGPQAAMLLGWDITIDNQLGRKYFANNTVATGAITTGEMEITAQLTVEASAAQSATEFTNWGTPTGRLVRILWGTTNTVSIDLPGYWNAFDLGQTDAGTRAYRLTLQYVYDPTNAFGVQFLVTNGRTTAWGAT